MTPPIVASGMAMLDEMLLILGDDRSNIEKALSNLSQVIVSVCIRIKVVDHDHPGRWPLGAKP